MLSQPALHSLMLVGCVVVADQVDLLVGRYCLIDHAQELQPLLVAVFLLTQAEDLAVGDIQRRKQGGRAVAFEIMRQGFAAALLEGKPGWVRSNV